MSRSAKQWLITAAFLIVIGGVLFSGVMMVFGWDFTKLSTKRYETNAYVIDEPFRNISVSTDTADVTFISSQQAKVICYEQKNLNHTVAVKDGTLTVELKDTRKWYEYIGINFGVSKITVCLPTAEYEDLLIRESTGDITLPADFRFAGMDICASTGRVNNLASVAGAMKIHTSTGQIAVKNVSAGTMDLAVSTGKVEVQSITCRETLEIQVTTGDTELSDIRCKALSSVGSTGDISLEKVIVQEQLFIKRSTGDVELDACDAGQITVKTGTGSVKGSLLSEKVFITQTGTGSIKVPKTTTGGKCEITTGTGDIQVEID